jgi:hypothetical protein
LNVPVCDCNQAKTRGILDINKPYYCQRGTTDTPHKPRISSSYTLVTKQKPIDIVENNPEISSEELQEWRVEESNTLISTINSPIFGGLLKVNQGKENIVWDLINWGLLRSKGHNNTKCVTYHGVGKVLTLEDCDLNYWT